jgi:hypothetical protein
MVKKLAIGLHKAAMMYDEKNCRKKIESLCGEYEWWKEYESTTDFFAVGIKDGVMDVCGRGTDGPTRLRRLAAWASSLDTTIDDRGRHRSFYDTALWAFDEIMETDIPAFKCIDQFGHSRFTGINPHLGIMLARRTGRPVLICDYAIAPTFTNYGIKTMWREACSNYRVSRWAVVNPRDALTGNSFLGMKLRGYNPEDGADAGEIVTLPPDTAIQRFFKKLKVPSLIEHSPKEYCDGLKII